MDTRTPDLPEEMTTGEFARRSTLSMKALRLYEQQGLLLPAVVNPKTGYRRYREDQLRTARLIVLLRRAGVPVADAVTLVSASGPETAGLLAAYWESQERQHEARRGIVAALRASLEGSDARAPEPPVAERDVPEQVVLTEQRHVTIGELDGWHTAAAARLTAAAGKLGGVAGERFTVFHGTVTPDSDGPVEVCVPVSVPPGRAATVTWRVEAAHTEAFIPVLKADFDVPAIWSVYDALELYAAEPGRARAGSPREVYRAGVDPATAAPEAEVADVAVPVARA